MSTATNRVHRAFEAYASHEERITNHFAALWGGFIGPKPVGDVPGMDAIIYLPTKLEHKRDEKAAETGNIFLETHNPRSNKPSGLKATQSLYWTYYIAGENRAFLFDPREMVKHLEANCRHAFKERVGDGNSSGYLLPIREAEKLPFVRIYKTPF